MERTARKANVNQTANVRTKASFANAVRRDFIRNRWIYLMLFPVVLYFVVFYYVPLYGIQIAFRNFSPAKGLTHSDWVGFQYFHEFFNSYYAKRIIRNTLIISFYDVLFTFPLAIALALMFNELRSQLFKRTVQSLTYLPHFISLVVVVGMMIDFLSANGVVNGIIITFGGKPVSFLMEPGWFRTLYVASSIWQGVGWGSIIYLAAMAGISPALYEAARMDGAGRFKQMLHVTIPGILPTVIIMFILRMGAVMAVNDEKILLMYNSLTYDTADVIGTFIYRKGILEANFSYSTAVGLFNSVINFALLIATNQFSKKFGETKLW